jgi:hypothetical protein
MRVDSFLQFDRNQELMKVTLQQIPQESGSITIQSVIKPHFIIDEMKSRDHTTGIGWKTIASQSSAHLLLPSLLLLNRLLLHWRELTDASLGRQGWV